MPTKKGAMKNVSQIHHLEYGENERTVKVRRCEHWTLTQMGRFNPISKGFITALRDYIKKNKDKAIKL